MSDFRRKMAERYLKKWNSGNKTPRLSLGFRRIKTIGILYDATFEETVKEVKQVSNKLKALGKEIYTLGFVKQKVLPANRLPHTRDDFFCRRDLTWNMLPKKERISRFANEEFDYLLCAFSPEEMALTGVSAMSLAKCRIGVFNQRYVGCFDVMLDIPGKKSATEMLDAYILFLYKLTHE